MNRTLVFVLIGSVLGTIPGLAAATLKDGGSDVASAPEIPLGQQVDGGGTAPASGGYHEFWRVTLKRADHLRLEYGTTNRGAVQISLYAPAVTDYTLPRRICPALHARNA